MEYSQALSTIANQAQSKLALTHQAREQAIPLSRKIIQLSAAAIRSAHRGEFDASRGILDQARENITQLKEALAEIPGVSVLSPMERDISSGLVSFSIDGVEPADVVSFLWAEHRIAARRVAYPPGVRASLHFFNTEEEVERLAAAVRERAEGS